MQPIFIVDEPLNIYTFKRNNLCLQIQKDIQVGLIIDGSFNKVRIIANVKNIIINGNNNVLEVTNFGYTRTVILNGINNTVMPTHSPINILSFNHHDFVNSNQEELEEEQMAQILEEQEMIQEFDEQEIDQDYDEEEMFQVFDESEMDFDFEEIRQDMIKSLNEFRFKDANKHMKRKEEQCVICFNEFKKNDLVKLFACNQHIYHKNCLEKWLEQSDICPLCKYNLF